MLRSTGLKILLMLVIFILPLIPKAQTGSCIDPALIREFSNCNHEGYNPVCGCDGITYMNMCSAVQHAGLIWINHEGPCEPVDAYIHFNPVDFYLEVSIATNQLYNVVVAILDLKGYTYYQQTFPINGLMKLEIPSSHFPNGYYILNVYTRSFSFADYFIKYSF